MKITKTQLKQIIKEELSSLSEGGEWGHFATKADPRGTSEPLTTDAPGMADMEDIYHDSEFLKMIREDFLMGYLPPRQDEIISDLKGVISDYLTRLKGHEGDTQAIGE